ncbi:hypothetical protein CFC21_009394 [Triticum aestivum]|uniref:Uncharacterized protein n=2 Tax=Triticum aestivum TaxID=4565 RepID=A0A3B5Z6F7_WHEAT|nr:uncharacterized protein LOC123149190 [Triticum aestivum]XP_044424697.1 uncharacterized protein LOC123149190 [Triticum aestivum]KAF6992398.1 hypothetical protein CFC21_009394 [Triticum aestivum]
MGKKPGSAGPCSASRPMNQAVSLREETSGKTQADKPSLLRVQHLQRLGAWASGEAGVGSIGALLGRRFATDAEAAGIPIDASTFLCQRCESILQPGFNCTIRIKNNKKKAKRRKKSNPGQNSVVYACHFCGDQNLIRGSGKGIVKGLLSSRKPVSTMLKAENVNMPTVITTKKGIEHSVTAASQLESSRLKISILEKDKQGNGPKSNLPEDYKVEKGAVFSMVDRGQLAAAHKDILQKIGVESTHDKCVNGIEPAASKNTSACEHDVTSQAEFLAGSNFVTPQKNKLAEVTAPIASAEALKTRSTLNNKAQNCGSAAGKAPGSYSKSASNTKSAPGGSTQPAGSSRKRARKGWTTLKQIAEKDELERKEKMDNFVIPFFMQ